jgi:hypothetical protein
MCGQVDCAACHDTVEHATSIQYKLGSSLSMYPIGRPTSGRPFHAHVRGILQNCIRRGDTQSRGRARTGIGDAGAVCWGSLASDLCEHLAHIIADWAPGGTGICALAAQRRGQVVDAVDPVLRRFI